MKVTSELKRCPKCGGPISAEAPQGLCPQCLLLQASIPTEVGAAPSAKSPAPTREELALAFPQLEILELIGQGGMGFVFKARQPKLERFVALKILPQSLAADPAFAERFTREGRVLARLNHPNIVTIHDFGQANGFFYLLMEFVDGVNLREAMKVGRFTPEQALAVVPKICDALQFAHNEGILHRDIKPENILLDAKGRVKIADFGIAKIVGAENEQSFKLNKTAARQTAVTGVMGTPQYMAPEQLEHPRQVDQRADIYSFGVVFYEMLTGELPVGHFAPPSQKSAADPRLDEVVLRALEKAPNRRTQSASEVKTQVETIATSAPVPAKAVTTPPNGERVSGGSRFGRGALIGLVVFTLILAGAIALAFVLPRTYLGLARVEVASSPMGQQYDPYRLQIEFEHIKSTAFLREVAASLTPEDRYSLIRASASLGNDSEVLLWLRGSLDLRTSRDTSLLEIWFYSDSPIEASVIANKIAETYCSPPEKRGEIIDRAIPATRPIRPNRQLIIFLGFLFGVVAGMVVKFIVGRLSFSRSRPSAMSDTDTNARPKFSLFRTFALWTALLFVALGCIAGLAVLILSKHDRFRPANPQSVNTPDGEAPILVAAAYKGDFGIYISSLGTVESSNSVVFNISEDYANEVIKKLNAHQALTVDAYSRDEKKFGHGNLRAVDNQIDTATGTLKCKANLVPDGDNLTIPGLFLNIRMLLETKHEAILVPTKAIRGDRGGEFVWVIQPDQTATQRRVKILGLDGKIAGIQNGLSPGELVVFEGQALLKEGVTISAKLVRQSAPPKETVDSVPPPQPIIGSLNLVAAGTHSNLALARAESLTGYPLHQIIARLAGPALQTEQWGLARSAATGPTLAPAPEEKLGEGWKPEPVESDSIWNSDNDLTVHPSSEIFECPNECQLQFALADEAEAKEAVRQINIALAKPIDLFPGKRIKLFRVGEREAWLEIREFRAVAGKLGFIGHWNRNVGKSPVYSRAFEENPTNRIFYSVHSAVVSIPPNAELDLKISLSETPSPLFSATLDSKSDKPGLYWLTWYALDASGLPARTGRSWEIFVHDAQTARELRHLKSTGKPEIEWQSCEYTETTNEVPGKAFEKWLFYGPDPTGAKVNPRYPFVNASMTMRPKSNEASSKESSDEMARLKLKFAEAKVKEAEKRLAVGKIDTLSYEQAVEARDILLAEMKGDAVEVARIKLNFAEAQVKEAGKRLAVGAAAPDEYENAKLARDLAEVALRQARNAKGK